MTIANIESLTRFLTNTDTTSLSAANLLILENKYYEEVTGLILSETAGAQNQHGDLNYGAFPTFSINLVAGTQSYSLKDFSSVPLVYLGVEVLDENGNPHVLRKTSIREIHKTDTAFDDYQSTDGLPSEYEIRDGEIVLYPAPAAANVTTSNGLILYYLRTADVFTSAQVSTGTKVPGFPSPWHDLLSWGPAYDYALANGLPNADRFKREYNTRLQELLDFISRRDQDPHSKNELSAHITSFA
jgi:hypothetical protein